MGYFFLFVSTYIHDSGMNCMLLALNIGLAGKYVLRFKQ